MGICPAIMPMLPHMVKVNGRQMTPGQLNVNTDWGVGPAINIECGETFFLTPASGDTPWRGVPSLIDGGD